MKVAYYYRIHKPFSQTNYVLFTNSKCIIVHNACVRKIGISHYSLQRTEYFKIEMLKQEFNQQSKLLFKLITILHNDNSRN